MGKEENLIITIARQFGSGGRTVAKLLADRLGIELLTRERIAEATEKLRAERELGMEHSRYYSSGATGFSGGTSYYYEFASTQEFVDQSNVVKQLAKEGSCVILGRCADYVLREHKKSVHIFIYADMETRRNTIVNKYNFTAKNVDKEIAKIDKARGDYYKKYTSSIWGNPINYDICVNTGAFKTYEETVDVLELYIRKKLAAMES